jgi:dolichol kinase
MKLPPYDEITRFDGTEKTLAGYLSNFCISISLLLQFSPYLSLFFLFLIFSPSLAI